MSIEEKRQEAFEAWFQAEMLPRITGSQAIVRAMCEKGWNAALDSVEIELPEEDPRGFGPGDCGDGRPSFEQQLAADCNCVLRECRAAIEACGLKVKQ